MLLSLPLLDTPFAVPPAAAPAATTAPAGAERLRLRLRPSGRRFRQPWHDSHPKRRELEQRLAVNHLARRIDRLVDTLDLTTLFATYAQTGAQAHPPDLLLKLALYELHEGERKPCRWAKHARENEPLRWLVRGLEPSQARLYAFRRRLGPLLLALNQQVLHSAVQRRLTPGTRAAQDGSTFAANASRHSMLNEKALQRRLDLLAQALLQDAAAHASAAPFETLLATPPATATPQASATALSGRSRESLDSPIPQRVFDQGVKDECSGRALCLLRTPEGVGSPRSGSSPVDSAVPGGAPLADNGPRTAIAEGTAEAPLPQPIHTHPSRTPSASGVVAASVPREVAPHEQAADASVAVGPAATPPEVPSSPSVTPRIAPTSSYAAPLAERQRPPGWMARTPAGRQRQHERYQQAKKRLVERLRLNEQRAKEDRLPRQRVVISPSDPEAMPGLDKFKVFRPLYNGQFLVDLDSLLILSYQTFAQSHDGGTLKPVLQRAEQLLGHPVEVVLADATYATGPNLALAKEQGVVLCSPWQSNDLSTSAKAGKKKQIGKEQFVWLAGEQTYQCPEGHRLDFVRQRVFRRNGTTSQQWEYRCAPEHCRKCPRQSECARNPKSGRTIMRNAFEEPIAELRARMATQESKELYRLRKQTVERAFADAKEHRGLRGFSGRGHEQAETETGLTVLVHNLLTVEDLADRRAEARRLPQVQTG
jgi:transposase